ncbi:MAG: hypothetical protein AAFV19_01015 [Pseudomonadota bacterium]
MVSSLQVGARIAPRDPKHVMRLSRMGAFHPSRLSFMRILLRRIADERWQFDRPVWKFDDKGVGHAVYRAIAPDRIYSLVVFAHDLPADQRSDRVIAEAWDATFALFDGEPTKADITRLSKNVPKQEAGRLTQRELTLSRANRSVRLFDTVVTCLANGRQPKREDLDAVGYLMRTTAVYGSGKFGLADRDVIAGRRELAAPFQAEMLTVWLIRAFTIDIADHLAAARGGASATVLSPELRRSLGVGNSTGLGMAPFLLRHPALIHAWVSAREEAFARVRRIPRVTASDLMRLAGLVEKARANAGLWRTDHPLQLEKLLGLRHDLETLSEHLRSAKYDGAYPWHRLWLWAERHLGIEAQEQLVSLMIEPYGALVDDLADQMSCDEEAEFTIDAQQTIGALKAFVETRYDWALAIDWNKPAANARLWYVSEEKLEPRLADRAEEPLEAFEQALAPGRDIAAMARTLDDWPDADPIAGFLAAHPEHRHSVRRVQLCARYPYAEVWDNTICADMMPIDLLRAKLSFFGATRFDPRSDRWVRIAMYLGAPGPEDLDHRGFDGWMLA